ncbi:hypothetical protein CRG98_015018 [Punica granatum]|uniref:Uncharacterized protein n=1 Tax=Punica granatum TaxID=22663 RepID=A0A2I0KA23_PUNGR|nr:hypothetical protein CRG98_015018 [Punica granatum]
MPEYEEGRISLRDMEPELKKEGAQALKPYTRCLLKAIERASDATYMIRSIGVKESQRLRHVNFFRKIPMKKCILHIKLSNGPLQAYGKGEDSADGDSQQHSEWETVELDPRCYSELRPDIPLAWQLAIENVCELEQRKVVHAKQ